MRKAVFVLLVLVICLGMCACNNEKSKHPTPSYLSQSEAYTKLIEAAEPELAKAIGLPTNVFQMKYFKVKEATHYESLGYWYFEIEGKIPMYDDGLWYINYSFDARVDDLTGNVSLGTLTKDYP